MIAFLIILMISVSVAHSANITPFITDGNVATITEFPYLVSIQEVNVQICGGSLLNEKWILSSGRCFLFRSLADLIVEYGNSVITPGVDGPRRTGIERFIVHEDFANGARLNDIALAESKIPIVTGFHNTFVKLAPPGNRFNSGLLAVHAGWGHIENGVRNDILKKADLRVLSFDECVAAVDGTLEPSKKHICATGESVMCTGDLGKLITAATFGQVMNNILNFHLFRLPTSHQWHSGGNCFL